MLALARYERAEPLDEGVGAHGHPGGAVGPGRLSDDGRRALVGAPLRDTALATDSGAASLYADDGAWEQEGTAR